MKPVADISKACIVLALLQFWSDHHMWVLYYYCPNLHIAVLGFNVKYYKDSSVLTETESFMSVFYSLGSGLTAALFSPSAVRALDVVFTVIQFNNLIQIR